jgi:hypothetical protein
VTTDVGGFSSGYNRGHVTTGVVACWIALIIGFKSAPHSCSAVPLMEMQEMIEYLLAEQAKAEADREQMLAEMKDDQEEAEAN